MISTDKYDLIDYCIEISAMLARGDSDEDKITRLFMDLALKPGGLEYLIKYANDNDKLLTYFCGVTGSCSESLGIPLHMGVRLCHRLHCAIPLGDVIIKPGDSNDERKRRTSIVEPIWGRILSDAFPKAKVVRARKKPKGILRFFRRK